MSFLDCHGQDKAILRLQRALQGNRLPHSYIFAGPDGVGKGMLAREWAKLQLCEKPLGQPFPPDRNMVMTNLHLDEIKYGCGYCPDCRMVEAGTHPDFHLVNRDLARFTKESRTKQLLALPIDVVREFVIKPAYLVPSRGRARIFVIEEAETMNRAAQNSVLKILEEPPHNTFLILLTTRPDKFLPTILSRCQLVRFDPLPPDYIYNFLLKRQIEAEPARFWAEFCQGSLGYALELSGMQLGPIQQEFPQKLCNLCNHNVLETSAWIQQQAKQFAQEYRKNRPDESASFATRQGYLFMLQMFMYFFSKTLAELSGVKRVGPDGMSPDTNEAQIAELSRRYTPAACARAIRKTIQAVPLLDGNVNPPLLFDSLMIEYLDYA